jgi:hypothetical protein
VKVGDTLITWDGTRGRIVKWRHPTAWEFGEPRPYQEVTIELPDGRRQVVLPENIRDIYTKRGP